MFNFIVDQGALLFLALLVSVILPMFFFFFFFCSFSILLINSVVHLFCQSFSFYSSFSLLITSGSVFFFFTLTRLVLYGGLRLGFVWILTSACLYIVLGRSPDQHLVPNWERLVVTKASSSWLHSQKICMIRQHFLLKVHRQIIQPTIMWKSRRLKRIRKNLWPQRNEASSRKKGKKWSINFIVTY